MAQVTYIEQEKLMRQVRLLARRTSLGETTVSDLTGLEVIGLILDAPAADVVERKHGEWAIDQEDLEWGNALKRRYCTNCKKRPFFDKEERAFVLTDFCPHCGADMRGGQE